MNNRLFLKNVPISMTKEQIASIFFPDLENVEINFTKRNDNESTRNLRNVYVQLKTKNEAVLCLKFINRLEYQNVEASFFETFTDNDTIYTLKENIKSCSFCGDKNSEFMCNDCNTQYSATYYCCKNHQERDWSRHKNECKSLPLLRRIDDFIGVTSTENIDTENKQPIRKGEKKYFIKVVDLKPNCKVVITSVINLQLLYIRQLCPEANDLFNIISHYSNSAPFLLEKPSIDEYVLVPNNNTYHRAKILDVFQTDNNGFNTRVILTDFGNEIMLKWQDMKHLNYKIRGKPSFTQKVILNGILNENYCQNINNYLQKLSLAKEELEIIQINGFKVTLKHSQTSVIINDVIKSMLKYSRDEMYFYDVKKIPKFSTKSTVKIFITDSSQLEYQKLLSCIPFEKLSDYLLMLDEFKQYCKRIIKESYLPKLNELCVVKFNEQWYRGSCSDINSQNEFIKFVLIDLMINVKIMKDDVRKIPQSFTQHFYTSLCYVEGINEENFKKIKETIDKEKCINACIRYDNETKCPVLSNLYY